MIQLEWPWLLLLLPLPLLLRWILPSAAQINDAALRVPFLDEFSSLGHIRHQGRAFSWQLLLAALAWFLLVAACARPQWVGEPVNLPLSGRDLMLAVDLSGSMEAEDFQINGRTVNRLRATQWVGSRFIERRVGDRIGLILFGRQAYVQTPLTFDRDTVVAQLKEAVIGLAGKETAIGDAIGLAVKRMRENDEGAGTDHKTKIDKSRVLILLTDGANTAGMVDPLKAAELAKQNGLKIYTIGIGADEMVVPSLFGNRRINPSADLDEKTLKSIADITGGQYFRARDTDAMEKIYQLLDKLEPLEQQTEVFRPRRSLYYWPLAIACSLAAMILLFRSMNGFTR